MKLRTTKWRIAVVLMLIPIGYVLNAVPMNCLSNNVPATRPFLNALYGPLYGIPSNSRLGEMFQKYLRWWGGI